MLRVRAIGGGAWGTALADVLARNGHDTVLWAREPDVVEAVNDAARERALPRRASRSRPRCAPPTTSREALDGAALVCLATPSQHLRAVVAPCGADARAATRRSCVASKGIERDTLALMSDVVGRGAPGRPVVALSGPSFAAEVVARQPTAIVAASRRSRGGRGACRSALSNAQFRVYTHDDVVGVELGGALKNVMAVATGIVEGVGLGFNSRAALITRGLAEMTRLGVALGAQPATFAGLAGHGRPRAHVHRLAEPQPRRRRGSRAGARRSTRRSPARRRWPKACATTQSALALAAREGVEMPIVEMVHRILFDGHPRARRSPS